MTEKKYTTVCGGIKDNNLETIVINVPFEVMLNFADIFTECSKILNELSDENKQLKKQLKEETNRVIKLEQYVYTKLCPKSSNYDEEVLSEILNAILGDVR